MNKKIVIDGHAHACGEYLTAAAIERKLAAANVDMVLLTPGQYGGKTTYGLKRLSEVNPKGDVVSRNNRTTSLMISLRTPKKSRKGGSLTPFLLFFSIQAGGSP